MTVPRFLDPEKVIPISRSTTKVFKTGTWGNRLPEYREKVSPCRTACPIGNNIAQALLKTSQGDFDGALSTFLEESPLPGVCGSVCYRPCETGCNRDQWDGFVNIRALERASAEYGSAQPTLLTKEGQDNPVTVVGSGPAGLSAAYHLARMGHPVALIEAEDELGGLLRWAIPRYRLPEHVLEQDLERILSLGIEVYTKTPVDGPMLGELHEKYRAVFIAVGAQHSISLDIPGINAKGIIAGLDFLKEVSRGLVKHMHGRVVVIGGGNVAIDAALTALRLDADHVEIVCLEQREDMPAHKREYQEAVEEGVIICNGWGPRRILEDNGRAIGVEFVKCISVFDPDGRFNPCYDETETLVNNADWLILAIGQEVDLSLLEKSDLFHGDPKNSLQVNPKTMKSPVDGFFAGGDFVQSPGSVVESLAAGKRAALGIHLYLKGERFGHEEKKVLLGKGPSFSIEALFRPRRAWNPHSVVKFEDMESLFLKLEPPVTLPRLDPSKRLRNFERIDLALGEDATIMEASRCFFCGNCTGCDRCFLFCPEICIRPSEEYKDTYEIDSDYCKACSVCEAVCLRGVVSMGGGK